ncbi:MAG: D-tyrosyl-tRNA(Tyr) deacylase [Cephaloticoccus sp.]|nr:D-tyrosyl-tRNA(Tyr) deacylase [Cephaloticoccus sp.]MCF7760684.1 D-tyrosyl-tRNA(Tyr) deacylase [Cephaloticoccus sp.]
MRAVVQRVASAQVTVDDVVVGSIGRGLLLLLGIAADDGPADIAWLSSKIAALRIFPDNESRLNLAVGECAGDILVVSQFTLIASTKKGNRPSFNSAATPDVAQPLYESFVQEMQTRLGRPIRTGMFGAMMAVALVNDGPVTLVIDSRLRE